MIKPTLFVLLAASAAQAAPVITEVDWAGSDASANDEWIEIFNPGPGALCDLSAFAIVQAGVERRLPAVALAENDTLVLERQASSTTLESPDAVGFTLGGGLTNGGQILKLCPFGDPASAACDVANPAGAAWFGGSNTVPKTSMERLSTADGSASTSWATGAPNSPGVVSFAGAVGDTSACVAVGEGEGDVVAGEGEGEGEGEPPPFVYAGLAITEIMFNPRATPEQGHEWVEIANLSSTTIDRADCVFEQTGAAAVALGTGSLAPGERIVLARDADLGINGLCLDNVVVVPTLVLGNSQTTLTVRSTSGAFTNTVVYGTAGNINRFNGTAAALRAVDVDNSAADAFIPAVCSYASTGAGAELGSPGVDNAFDAACTAPVIVACVGEGEGEATDAGFADAGPNALPEITVTSPTGSGSADDGFDIAYDASDADDAVSVDVYLAIDDAGQDGLRVARGLPGGVVTRHVDVDNVPAGTWHVFAVARDSRGATAYAYAPGTVDIGGGGPVDAAFKLLEPDGVNDDAGNGIVSVTWSVDLPAGQTGTIALFLDTDDDATGGTPLAGGLPAVSVVEGEEVGRAFALDTSTLDPGTYRVYGVLSHAGSPISSVADGSVVVTAEGCACASGTTAAGGKTNASRSLPALVALAMLGFLFVRRGLRRFQDVEGG